MKTKQRILDTVSEGIDRIVKIVSIGLMVFLVCLVLASVFFRYVLSNSLSWSEETARYICIWIGFLSASMAFKRHMHIGLSYFVDKLTTAKPQLKPVIISFNYLLILIFLSFVIWQGVILTMSQTTQTAPTLSISMVLPYSAVPFGAGLLWLEAFRQLYVTWTEKDSRAVTC